MTERLGTGKGRAPRGTRTAASSTRSAATETGGEPSPFDAERSATRVAELVARHDRVHLGQAMALGALARQAPAPPGALARALKALAGRRVVIVKATEAGISVRLRGPDGNGGGDLPSYEPGTREWRVARWLVRRGQRPTEAAVAERLRAIEAARRSEERRARWKADLDTEAAVVVAFVRSVREATAAGPTWAEVGAHLGSRYAEGNFKLARLVATGVLSATREARSLDVPSVERCDDNPHATRATSPKPAPERFYLGESA